MRAFTPASIELARHSATASADAWPTCWPAGGPWCQAMAWSKARRRSSGTPEARAVAAAVSPSLLASVPVLSQPHPERKTVLIDPQETIRRWRLDRRFESTLAPSDLSGAVRSTADQLLRHRLDVATLPDAATFADGLEVSIDRTHLSALGRSLLTAAAERFPGVEEFAFTPKFDAMSGPRSARARK